MDSAVSDKRFCSWFGARPAQPEAPVSRKGAASPKEGVARKKRNQDALGRQLQLLGFTRVDRDVQR